MKYHNDLHGSDCAQHVSFMLNQQSIQSVGLGKNDVLSLLVAALAHDVNHNGFNNGYHKRTNSRLHKAFGDESI